MTIVIKIGGTSVGTAEALKSTAKLVETSQDEWGRVVVVVSAMSGMTDLLFQAAHAASMGDEKKYEEMAFQIRQNHYLAISKLMSKGIEGQLLTVEIDKFLDRFEILCQAVLVLGELTPRALATISGIGEQVSARILASYLCQHGCQAEAVDATELIITDENFESAAPLIKETSSLTRSRLGSLLDQGTVPIVTGFIGATKEGVTTTLGRGGSDYSAAILGLALEADEVWIWTDVDGVMTADPRLVANARTIESLSYREVAELAYYGAKVLHPKTIRPVIENDIALRIKNTFNPDHPGTLIVAKPAQSNGNIKAVTAIRDLSMINVEGKGMMGVPGIAARTFTAVARIDVSVLLISQASSEQSICFVMPSEYTDLVIASLEEEFSYELDRRDIDRIWAMRSVAIVTTVGAGMRGTPGIAGRMFSALGEREVNIIAIAQGSSECSISMVVDDPEAARAEEAIHELIINGK